ncbi:DUF3592 domain-containing protein [Streptomyces sp. NPDC014995]|uniref:DUF3592 domain-containing protein n=1 Tax=Streptomyces sp. NPDC014995 TaxID=3364936 RepID=UPI0036F59CC8
MDVIFLIVPSIMIAGLLFAAGTVIRRSRRITRAWAGGLTAEARCLRSYTTTSGGGGRAVRTNLHHVYEFTTREGRTVRFEEGGGPGTTVEGDLVTVHYAADRPARATARPPARGRLLAESGCTLFLLGVAVAFCVVLMVTSHVALTGNEYLMP